MGNEITSKCDTRARRSWRMKEREETMESAAAARKSASEKMYLANYENRKTFFRTRGDTSIWVKWALGIVGGMRGAFMMWWSPNKIVFVGTVHCGQQGFESFFPLLAKLRFLNRVGRVWSFSKNHLLLLRTYSTTEPLLWCVTSG